MRNLFIWENPIDWSYMYPIAKYLRGDCIFVRRHRTEDDPHGIIHGDLDYFNPDNILVFRYDTFKMIEHLPGKKYQLYHGLADKGFKCIGGQIWRLGMHYDYFIEAGPYYRDRMITHGGVPSDRVVALGYPKLDTYDHYVRCRTKTISNLGLNPNHPIIFYAPSCREQNSLYSYLDAQFQGEVLENCLPEIIPPGTQASLIIKLHDEIPRLQTKIKELMDPRIVFVKDYTSVPYLAAANIVLSDCSSIMLEAMAVNKPVIQYINNEKNFCKTTCDWWDYTHQVHNLRELREAVILCLQNPDVKKDRREYYRDKMFVNLHCAGQLVANFIEEHTGK